MRAMHIMGGLLSIFTTFTLIWSCQSPSPPAGPTTISTLGPVGTPPTLIIQSPVSPPATDVAGVSSQTADLGLPSPTTARTDWTVYRTASSYPELPLYEIHYPSKTWALVADLGVRPRLEHQTIPDCYLWPSVGPIGAERYKTTHLAGREWAISIVESANLIYGTQYQVGGFLIGVHLPEESLSDNPHQCQIDAEQVIDTFTIIEE